MEKLITPHQKMVITGLLALIFLVITSLILFFMGRLVWCECGYAKIWHSGAWDSGTSQHLFDPYTITHILHGMGMYLLLWFARKKIPVFARFIIAVGVESGWEIAENTSWMIQRYRGATASLNYSGDSVINSMGDIIASTLGFYLAYKLPSWAIVTLLITLEVTLAVLIRDSLILNIIMLIYPLEAVKIWQSGG